jgi:DNA-binding transcriptional LysR family regulator
MCAVVVMASMMSAGTVQTALERAAGVSLFEHVGRRMILTDLGRRLVRDSVEVLAALERADANLERAAGGVTGVVRLAAIPTVGMTLLPPALATLSRKYPALVVEHREAEAEEALPLLDTGEIDLVVAYRLESSPGDPRHDERVLGLDPLGVALSTAHPLAGQREIPLRLLADAHWVSARAGSAFDDMFCAVCRTIGGLEPDIRHRWDSVGVIVGLVVVGAVAIVPTLGWPEGHPGAVIRPVVGHRLEREIFSATRATSAQRPSIGAVREALREAWESQRPASART